MQKDRVTKAHIEKYLAKTKEALTRAKICPPNRSIHRKTAEDFHGMAKAYFEDAKHFFDEGDYVNSFACVNYAHGWLDAGARLGLFDVGEDDQLFTLSE